jgi:hypothetical protein
MSNYAAWIAAGKERTLEERLDFRRGELYACPLCAAWCPAALLADVAGLAPAGSERWACDGCWSEWKRRQVPLVVGDDFVTEEEWWEQFCSLTYRDSGNRDAFIGRQYAVEADRLRGVLARLDPSSDDARDVEVRLAKVIARSTLPVSWDKTTIAADGVDAAILSGLPVSSEVFVDGTRYAVDDGVFELVATTPGDFAVEARHPRFIWEAWTIYAR